MDIKISGIPIEILKEVLLQARQGIRDILKIMNEVISHHQSKTADHAPQFTVIKVEPHKIRDIIGKGGVVIKRLVEKTGAFIDTYENGEVKIFAQNKSILQAVISEIRELTIDIKAGQVYTGNVVKVLDFGVFINILSGRDGLLLFTDLKSSKVTTEHLKEGFSLKVLVQHIDRVGKIKLLPV
jgi:polyribonucleotide nucleotidyltransferase